MAFTAAAHQVLVVTIVFAVLTLFAVIMRLVAKFHFLKSARKEEVVMIFCLVSRILKAVGNGHLISRPRLFLLD